MILCNPHNPGGRVWTMDELRRIADICMENHTFVISDEIHADLTLPPYKHHPFATVSGAAAQNSLTFMAPSKTFNMPGLGSSYAIILNEDIRHRFQEFMEAGEFSEGHMLAYIGAAAAYMHGEEWLEQLLDYIKGNIDFTENYLREHIPGIGMIHPQASYLIWLDCRELGLSHEALNAFFVDKAGLALNDGEMFGKEGAEDWAPADTDETQLELFSTERSRVKERPGNGTWWYWLRSPYGSDSAGFCIVDSDGDANYYTASGASGVAFGFCL